MLIAIMSDTFGRQIEDIEMKSKQQKLNLQAEYAGLVEIYDKIFSCFKCCSKKKDKDKINSSGAGYLFVVRPKRDQMSGKGAM